ncbi:PD-(D/E)XK nuclease family protein [Mongoliitalea daihaiensis]|uniref:PD-(D/E)XK nuclease family protein n=1 Tax=Mongoliitalea daihaiensis TaxID=2782006 RepID=UPI001F1ACB27|nr:PD-(D/E)XK nuclease family protein [Mongoliitalea daihaiensis]UJP63344.1 PD-(D/E)XK nuclease family protein [Mongoliitalea daihaiensis]
MNSFLKDTAQQVLNSGRDLSQMVVVMPNRRAGLFFIKYLEELINAPTWMPEVKTIEQVFSGIANQRAADDLTLIFELYDVYLQLQPEAETFDRFYFWGELILKDFNDLDQFLADAKLVYRNLSEIKAIESDLSFLTTEQVALISQFWKSFQAQKPEEKERFLRFWQVLEKLYEQFNAQLDVLGLAYGGKVYRKAVSKLPELAKPEKHYVFIGFNAFTLAEEKLIKHFIKNYGAEVYWDVDAYYIQDQRQESGLFFRDYIKDPILGPTFPQELPHAIESKSASIHTYAIPLKINQANVVGKLLEGVSTEESLEETVVILPDEQLLFPLLHVLPDNVDKLNVTMGYPIRNAPVYAFLDAILDLQRYIKVKEGKVTFYHKQVLDLLSFPYLAEANPEFTKELKSVIQTTNLIEIPLEQLQKGGGLFQEVFQKVASNELVNYLAQLMQLLAQQLKQDTIQSSYLFQAYKQLNRIQEVLSDHRLGNLSLEFFLKLFRQLFQEVRLPFEGEPLQGLQVMGVLESRNLDFRRVIICDVNEGSFPPGGGINSMIPHNLRRAFGLPVQEQNDAIYAYTFYRLLHRAEEVHLIYSTASDQGKNGEMSRFLQQMHVELGISKPQVQLLSADLNVGKEITVLKDEAVMKKLSEYWMSSSLGEFNRSLSASAINSYLDCRLRFYLRYVAGLKEQEEVTADVDAGVFGTILHRAIELLYLPEGEQAPKLFTPHELNRIQPTITTAVDNAIREFYHVGKGEDFVSSGQMQIVREIFFEYIQGIVAHDIEQGDFTVLGLEQQHTTYIPVQVQGRVEEVRLYGLIDRVDQKDGVIRLLDYKTGKDEKKFNTIASLFDREDKNRNKAAMQTMLYAYFYQFTNPSNQQPLKPGLFNVKEIFKDNFNPFLIKSEGKLKLEVENYLDLAEEFEQSLSGLLSELFDPAVPFDQTADVDKCKYCAFKEMCGR